MKEYKINIDKSKEVFNKCKSHIAIKECYNNVFRVSTDYSKNFNNNKWRVTYGYMTVTVNLLCRHCFIIDENNEVIDPTILLTFKGEAPQYFAMKIFDNYNEYLSAIERERRFPALNFYLRNEDFQAEKWAQKNNYILIG